MCEYCSTCGITFFEMALNNKFGCSDCYVSFKEHAKSCFAFCQSGYKHIGKTSSLLKCMTIEQLKLKIKDAILIENYELANECKLIISLKSTPLNL